MALDKFLTINDTTNTRDEETAIKASTGSGDANKIIATDSTGKIAESLLPSSALGSTVISVQATEALSARDAVNIYNDSGNARMRKADANNSRPAHGFVTAAVSSGSSGDVYYDGVITGFSGLTAGGTVFLSETPGGITQSGVSDAGDLWQVLGKALTPTQVYVDIDDAIARS